VQGLHVLPVLLEQRNKEVDAQHHVSKDLVISHLDMTDGNTQAKNLLKLELDRRTDLSNLVTQILSVRNGGRELSGFRKTWPEETRDLLNQGFGSQESIVFLGKLFNELLILVKLF